MKKSLSEFLGQRKAEVAFRTDRLQASFWFFVRMNWHASQKSREGRCLASFVKISDNKETVVAK